LPDELSNLLLVAVIVASCGLYLYSSYWAFSTRKVLVARIYRRQALWVAINALYFALFFAFAGVAIALGGPSANGFYVDILGDIFTIAAFVVIFAWIDSSIRVARRSDPLHRNTLHWTALRYFLLVVTSFGILFSLIIPSAYQQQNSATVQGFVLLGPIGTSLLFGGIALILSARRSKDPILQKHLAWFGAFIIFLFLTNRVEQEVFGHFISPSSTSGLFIAELITYALFLVSSYFLYESARSLTRVNRYPSSNLIPDSQQVAS
jgi:hypothetical protein